MDIHRTHIDDKAGLETLQSIRHADRFNAWMYAQIKPYCKGKVLEIGSGIGNISKFILHDGFTITLSDYNSNYCDTLATMFADRKHVQDILHLDILDADFNTKYASLFSSFDTIIGLNVIEHVDDDRTAIENCKKLLAPDGVIIMLVPAYNWLFNSIDTALGHFRRYNKKKVRTLFSKTQMQTIHIHYFNASAIGGWFVSGKILKNAVIKQEQMKLYNRLVPVFKFVDICTFNKVGISLIAVASKMEKN